MNVASPLYASLSFIDSFQPQFWLYRNFSLKPKDPKTRKPYTKAFEVWTPQRFRKQTQPLQQTSILHWLYCPFFLLRFFLQVGFFKLWLYWLFGSLNFGLRSWERNRNATIYVFNFYFDTCIIFLWIHFHFLLYLFFLFFFFGSICLSDWMPGKQVPCTIWITAFLYFTFYFFIFFIFFFKRKVYQSFIHRLTTITWKSFT